MNGSGDEARYANSGIKGTKGPIFDDFLILGLGENWAGHKIWQCRRETSVRANILIDVTKCSPCRDLSYGGHARLSVSGLMTSGAVVDTMETEEEAFYQTDYHKVI